MARLVLRADTLIDGGGGPPLRMAELAIENGRIVRVGRAGAEPDAQAQIVDYGKATLLPGLIDSHVHLQFSAAATTTEVVAAHRSESDAQLAMRAIANAQKALAVGVTALRDCGGRLDLNVAVRDMVSAGHAVGPRLLVAGAPITTTSGHLYWCGLTADTADELRRAVRRMVEAGVDFIKVMATGGGMTPISNARRPQYSLDQLAALVADAHRLNKRVAAHVLASDGCEFAIDAGVNTFEHFRWTADAGVDYRPEAIRRMNPKTQSINATYTALDRGRFAGHNHIDEVSKQAIKELRDHYWTYRDAAEKGITVTSSSDAGVPNAHFDGFPLSVISGMVAMDDSPVGAIFRATLAAARAIGMEAEIGSLEAGKAADVLVVKGDAADDIFALTRPIAVYLGGREIAREGRLQVGQVGELASAG